MIEEIAKSVKLEEGYITVEHLLLMCYFHPGISTKKLAQKLALPKPIVAAIKNEFIKVNVLVQKRGVFVTNKGIGLIESEFGYKNVDKHLYLQIVQTETEEFIEDKGMMFLDELTKIHKNAPQIESQFDQSKCTPKTSLKRALLSVKNYSLVGKKVLCLGDDDLVSIALAMLLTRLFPYRDHHQTEIHVIDIDERFLSFISAVAKGKSLPIICHHVDLRRKIPSRLAGVYDTVYTDPPYTNRGMSLFLSCSIECLKKEKGLIIYLSFAQKSADLSLHLQKEWLLMGLAVMKISPGFNDYIGAQMIGNQSQMIILKTTSLTKPLDNYELPIYTGEIKQTIRSYKCLHCHEVISVGTNTRYRSIEYLKDKGCPVCNQNKFHLIKKERV